MPTVCPGGAIGLGRAVGTSGAISLAGGSCAIGLGGAVGPGGTVGPAGGGCPIGRPRTQGMTPRTRRHPRPAAARLAMLVAATLALGGCATGGIAITPSANGSPGASVIQIGSPLIGKPAPALVGTTLDGSPFDLASLRGSPVLVNFWASWCGPCREEFPLLAAAEKRHAAQGLKVIGVLFKDDAAPARTFVADEKADWPTVTDPARTIAQPWAVLAPPQSYFIDRAGIVRDIQIGQVRDATELDAILAAILT